ncbi:MAG: hypothetical protein ACYSU1_08840 [Planctomycetota bacterium]|jgi:hypothetical protein
MTDHRHIYQAMFLLDNEEVRKGFNAARDWVKITLEKYGLEVKVLRCWARCSAACSSRKRPFLKRSWLTASRR